ncbi:hypothetical protein CcaverHIS002_0312230 [Cutaneotrichosporon cavernicola]|nr:hypothetical protein CcaverHIS002_0312230 [Cutaneotrichosporon cavernicola]BEI98917.1 hypothetical protein CcaverHIS631_0312160 [Cutaneotrichosporon cavernicola]BEJ06691.1 hypothetical protein CcaverHIS641_0312130 [Cutaneotrichosporon cavernicola]
MSESNPTPNSEHDASPRQSTEPLLGAPQPAMEDVDQPPRRDSVDPGQRKRRNIVLLLDGTGKEFGDMNSNLIKLHTVLQADEDQLIYYSSGLGTVLPSSTGSWATVRRQAAMAIDLALAWNFDDFVCDAYAYLMDYYTPGDHVFIFGYSRGAYVARALAGMIQKVGLLPRGNRRSVQAAYRVYTSHTSVRGERPGIDPDHPGALYRRIFGLSRPVIIEFLGAWDTVSSLGGIGLPRLPFAGGVQAVRFFRQALALDERRIRFTPEYRHADRAEIAHWRAVQSAKSAVSEAEQAGDAKRISETEAALAEARAARDKEYPSRSWTFDNQRVKERQEELWFMGAHSDVGGGRDLNGDPSLSNIPFRWILREAVDCGLLISATGVRYLRATGLPIDLPTIREHCAIDDPPTPATMRCLADLDAIVSAQLKHPQVEQDRMEEMEALRAQIPQSELRKIVNIDAERDACATPTADLLCEQRSSLQWLWWLLEFIPLKTRRYSAQPDADDGGSKWTINCGRPRQMVNGQRVHVSVLHRMNVPESEAPRYRPSAKLGNGLASWDEAMTNPNHSMWASSKYMPGTAAPIVPRKTLHPPPIKSCIKEMPKIKMTLPPGSRAISSLLSLLRGRLLK